MSDIVVEIFDNEQKIASKRYRHPQTAAEVKTALVQEDMSWVGTLRKGGSPTVLTGGRRLEGGALHHFQLQRRSSKSKLVDKCYTAFLVTTYICSRQH